MIHCFPLPTSYPSEVGGKSRNSSESKANKNSRAFRGQELGLWWNNLIFTQFHLQSLFWEGLDGKRICLQCRRRGFDPWFGKIPYSSILAWRIPMDRGAWRAQRVGHDWATKHSTCQAQQLGESALAAGSLSVQFHFPSSSLPAHHVARVSLLGVLSPVWGHGLQDVRPVGGWCHTP